MLTILLAIIGLTIFVTTGFGYLLFNVVILGLLEIGAVLFSGLIGFIILGLVISWVLASFNKHT